MDAPTVDWSTSWGLLARVRTTQQFLGKENVKAPHFYKMAVVENASEIEGHLF
jgi:hypothetical protein